MEQVGMCVKLRLKVTVLYHDLATNDTIRMRRMMENGNALCIDGLKFTHGF